MLLTAPFNKALTLKSTSILSSPLKVKDCRQLPPHLTLMHCKHVINQFLSLICLCCETTVATFTTHCVSLLMSFIRICHHVTGFLQAFSFFIERQLSVYMKVNE